MELELADRAVGRRTAARSGHGPHGRPAAASADRADGRGRADPFDVLLCSASLTGDSDSSGALVGVSFPIFPIYS